MRRIIVHITYTMVLSGIQENIPQGVIVYHQAEGWEVYIYSSGIFSCIPRSTIVWGICLIPRKKCESLHIIIHIIIRTFNIHTRIILIQHDYFVYYKNNVFLLHEIMHEIDQCYGFYKLYCFIYTIILV